MSNLGTTLKAMGRASDAVQWWWKAVNLRPYYWDAVVSLWASAIIMFSTLLIQGLRITSSVPLWRKSRAIIPAHPKGNMPKLCGFAKLSRHGSSEMMESSWSQLYLGIYTISRIYST